MENELYHHGILGMKWGVRRYQNKDGSLTAAGKKRYGKTGPNEMPLKDSSDKNSLEYQLQNSQKNPRYMTDAELNEAINRLSLEKRYADLVKSMNTLEPKKKNRAVEFIEDVVERTGKNLAPQLLTYAIGDLINKAAKKEIVNPKKGQKDK